MNESNIVPSGLRRRAFVVTMSKLTTRKHRVKKTSNKSKTNTIKTIQIIITVSKNPQINQNKLQ